MTASSRRTGWGGGLSVLAVVVVQLGLARGALGVDPLRVEQIGKWTGEAHGVAIAEPYAYVAEDRGGLAILDVSNPASPQQIGHHDSEGAYRVAIAGPLAYTFGRGAFQVVDVSNPEAPRLVGSYGEASYPLASLVVSGNYAYLTGVRRGGLCILDVSEPTLPTWVGAYAGVYDADDLVIVGTYAYVGEWHTGLHIVDVSDPRKPERVGSFRPFMGGVNGVGVAGSYAYIGNRIPHHLRVLDISDPTAPIVVGYYPLASLPEFVTVSWPYAYVTDGALLILDISTPSQPVRVGYRNRSGAALQVVAVGPRLYLADGTGGLVILRVHLRGDMDCDWRLTFNDINPFVLALAQPEEYARRYPECSAMNADCNGDERVTFSDINPFVELLASQ